MNVSKCWHVTCFVRWANRIAIFRFGWKMNLRLPPRKKKTLPLKVVCLLMLLDWPEEEFRIHCASFNDNDIPLSPQFQRWLRHAQVLTKRSVFFLWRASTPRTLFYPSTLNLGVRGGAQEILASVRHKSWKSNRVAVAVITRSVFFLRGGVIQITFHPKLNHCHSIRPANKACVSVCQRFGQDRQLNKTS